VVATCPECGTHQGIVAPDREALSGMLKRKEDVLVLGPVCGHAWKLDPQTKTNIASAIERGLI
jgi:hypothetical protein